MGIFFFVFFLPLSVVYLGLSILGFVYCYMGLAQLANGYSMRNNALQRNGILVALFSLALVGACSYFYFTWVWFW